MNIALVTYQDQGGYHAINVENEDDQLISFLQTKGLVVTKVIWNDESVNWGGFDLAILKSPWDYFNLIEDFYSWLKKLEDLKIKLLNPIETVRWNADKHYLDGIERFGLATTPSAFIKKGDENHIDDYFNSFNSEKLIIKPCISGGSKNTFKVTKANAEKISAQLSSLLENEDFIVQPFLNEIEEQGEWSFIFFGGKFSHAVLKKAQDGDFRVQATFGGTVHPQIPSEELLVNAQQYVDQFAKNCLYARVDGTIVNKEFMLMELELIEPFLFMETNPESFENYYNAFIKLVN